MVRIPRLAMYGLLSTAGASAVVGSAIRSKPNFYTAAVTIGQSSGALMVLANFMLFNVICLGVGVKALFFGRLRRVEYEHLFERLWIFLTESLLAMTIFRDDFSVPFAIMFGVLVFIKCFHWITADRVDYMDQVPHPGPPLSFHCRIAGIIVLLTVVDFCLIAYALESLLYDGASATILFASEFLILLATINGVAARYVVGVIDIRRSAGDPEAPPWVEKSMWLFYIDLAVDFAKLLTYLAFFLAILLSYGLPLHILRDVYMTLRSFLSRVQDLLRYRRATKDMDSLYPDATHAELQGGGGDGVCIICREEMVASDAPAPVAAPEDGPQREIGVGSDGIRGGPDSGDTATAAVRQAQQVPHAQPQPQQPQQQQQQRAGPNETPKKLQCGHIFHFHCLRSWLERQQSCPTCRRDVLNHPQPQRPNRPPVNGLGGIFDAPVPQPPAPAPAAPAPAPAPAAAAAAPALTPGAAPTAAPDHPSNRPNALPTQQGTGTAGVGPSGSHTDASAAEDEATRMRRAFEQYFRFPGSGFAPTQAMPARSAHAVSAYAAGGSSSAGPSRSTVPTAVAPQDHHQPQIQPPSRNMGIWGGPIEVGRFFVPPLGAAPRFAIGGGDGSSGMAAAGYAAELAFRQGLANGPHQPALDSHDAAGIPRREAGSGPWDGLLRDGGRSGSGLPEIRLPSGRADQDTNGGFLSGRAEQAVPFSGQQQQQQQQASPTQGGSFTSGAHTPAYSNPPTVFRSLSESGPRPAVPPKTGSREQVELGDVGSDDQDDDDDDDDVEVVQMSEAERRRAVAEATARRLGLGVGVDKGKGKAKAEAEAEAVDDRIQNAYSDHPAAPYLVPSADVPILSPILGEQQEQEQEQEQAAEMEMAKLLSVALDQGRPLHLRHPHAYTPSGSSQRQSQGHDDARVRAAELATASDRDEGELQREVDRLKEELRALRQERDLDQDDKQRQRED